MDVVIRMNWLVKGISVYLLVAIGFIERSMMKFLVTLVASVLCGAVIVFFVMNERDNHRQKKVEVEMLHTYRETVEKNLIQTRRRVERQVAALAAVIAANNEFSLKILVENDPSSRVITDMAAAFLEPMGFTILEITDSASKIISSGHFPASAGNKCVHKAAVLSDKAVVYTDNPAGNSILTMQTKRKFTIAEFDFYVMGGISVDDSFLAAISPGERVRLLLKNGDNYIGMDSIVSISAIKDNELIINDVKYLASEIKMETAGMADSLSLFVLVEK